MPRLKTLKPGAALVEEAVIVPCKHCRGTGTVFVTYPGPASGRQPCPGCKGAGVHKL